MTEALKPITSLVEASSDIVHIFNRSQEKSLWTCIKDFFLSLVGSRTPQQLIASRVDTINNLRLAGSISQKKVTLLSLQKKLNDLKSQRSVKENQESSTFFSLGSLVDLNKEIEQVETKIQKLDGQIKKQIGQTETQIEKQIDKIVDVVIKAPLFKEGDILFNTEEVCKKTANFYEQILSHLKTKQENDPRVVKIIDQMVAIKNQQISILEQEEPRRSVDFQKTLLRNDIQVLTQKR